MPCARLSVRAGLPSTNRQRVLNLESSVPTNSYRNGSNRRYIQRVWLGVESFKTFQQALNGSHRHCQQRQLLQRLSWVFEVIVICPGRSSMRGPTVKKQKALTKTPLTRIFLTPADARPEAVARSREQYVA